MISDRPQDLASGYDVTVVGGGPAGMAAALGARAAGADRVLLLDRDGEAGGILNQCIHAGFGVHWFGEELTGPEYAQRFFENVLEEDVDVLLGAYVLDAGAGDGVRVASPAVGLATVPSRAVVLAMGARERTRAAVRIPGPRPAGVMTAGFAQKLVNQEGYLPGRRVAILGSGDIGLIMARRLILEGVDVTGVYELMPHANGSNRNVVQCLDDFGVPLHVATSIAEIRGRDRVEGIRVAPVGPDGRLDVAAGDDVACDTVLTSIGLIPENELSRTLRLRMDPATGGPVVTSAMETSRDGVFACGNVVHVHDLVDHVSREADLAGRAAGAYAVGAPPPDDNVRLVPGDNVRSCVPHTISTDRTHVVHVRVTRPMEACTLRLGDVHARPLRYAVPGEMTTVKLRPRALEGFAGGSLRVDVVPREEGAKA